MKIKCIKNNISQIQEDRFLFDNLTLMEFHQDGEVPHLDIGNFYEVYAICIRNKYPWFYICDEGYSFPLSFPLPFFEIIDNRLSKYWTMGYNCSYIKNTGDDIDILFAFKEWTHNKYFYEKLLNGKGKEIFLKYKSLMDVEFPDSNLRQAEVLKDNWIMCPECNESWEEFKNDGILRCPKCLKQINNPLYCSPELDRRPDA
jgi:hypothetical protein